MDDRRQASAKHDQKTAATARRNVIISITSHGPHDKLKPARLHGVPRRSISHGQAGSRLRYPSLEPWKRACLRRPWWSSRWFCRDPSSRIVRFVVISWDTVVVHGTVFMSFCTTDGTQGHGLVKERSTYGPKSILNASLENKNGNKIVLRT